MPQQKSKNTKQNHWDKLDALIANTVEPTGDDWFTCHDIQKRYDVSKTTARSRICDMKKRNLIEEWAGGNKETGGCCVKYRLKD
jgi:DNA-binding FadR family transcriptional regulator